MFERFQSGKVAARQSSRMNCTCTHRSSHPEQQWPGYRPAANAGSTLLNECTPALAQFATTSQRRTRVAATHIVSRGCSDRMCSNARPQTLGTPGDDAADLRRIGRSRGKIDEFLMLNCESPKASARNIGFSSHELRSHVGLDRPPSGPSGPRAHALVASYHYQTTLRGSADLCSRAQAGTAVVKLSDYRAAEQRVSRMKK